MNRALLILPFVILTLLMAIWGGWIRIGFPFPLTITAVQHGSLMVNGFLGSVIFLERAVTFRNKRILLLPLVNVLGIIPALLGFNEIVQLIHIAGSLGFVIMCAYFIYRHKEQYYYVFFAGAFALLTGNLLLYNTQLFPAAVTWWMVFLLFTIVAERLELTRFLPLLRSRQNLLMVVLAFTMISSFIPFHWNGNILLALAFAAVAAWLLKYDMAFKSVRAKGAHRYSGLLLIVGYCWLFITAAFLVLQRKLSYGYDAALHSFFIGFVFSMIFSHAPIILPAVARLPVKIYRPQLYYWFALLQLSLVVRIIADVAGVPVLRKYSGFSNGVAMLLFFATIAVTAVTELKKRKYRLS